MFLKHDKLHLQHHFFVIFCFLTIHLLVVFNVVLLVRTRARSSELSGPAVERFSSARLLSWSTPVSISCLSCPHVVDIPAPAQFYLPGRILSDSGIMASALRKSEKTLRVCLVTVDRPSPWVCSPLLVPYGSLPIVTATARPLPSDQYFIGWRKKDTERLSGQSCSSWRIWTIKIYVRSHRPVFQ